MSTGIEQPVVSICVVAYNHASYIRECLDSLLSQECDYPYEICIGEDESEDGTREICKEYARKHPNTIRLFERNRKDVMYVQGRPTGRTNFFKTVASCRGQYIAFCEGDDFWHCSTKLQRQVEVLESCREYSMCHSEHRCIDEVHNINIDRRWESRRLNHVPQEGVARLILTDDYLICTCTVLARTYMVKQIFKDYFEDFDNRFRMADMQLWFHLARKGKVAYLNEPLATYRRNAGSSTAIDNLQNRLDFMKNVYNVSVYMAQRYGYDDEVPTLDALYLNTLYRLSLLSGNTLEAKQYSSELSASCLWHPNEQALKWVSKSLVFVKAYRFLYVMRTNARKIFTFEWPHKK